MSRKMRWIVGALGLLALPAGARAQEGATLVGTVRSRSQVPVPGAFVIVPQLKLSAITNAAGAYRLVVPAGQAQGSVKLTVSSVGYRTADVTVALHPGVVPMDVELQEEAVALEAVVVTGTAVGSQLRRAQPAVIASVNTADLVKTAPVTTVTQVLQSRVPGVSVTGSSGSSGTTQAIRIRGPASLSLSNEPLIFIDGVLANGRNTGGQGANDRIFTGGQAVSALYSLNPEDIESIEVVKGPAAATLYGADASAGVIQIITKKGRPGAGRFAQNVAVEYSSLDQNWTPPSNFARCSAATVAPSSINPLCRGQTVGTVVSDNPLVREQVFRTGNFKSLAWSGRGGGESYGYYLSLLGDLEDGTLPNNGTNRRSGRANFTWTPDPRVTLEAGFGLIRSDVKLPDSDNDIYGFMGGALLGNPLSRVDDSLAVGFNKNNGWYAPNRNKIAIENIKNDFITTRTTPTLTVRYSPMSWFTHRLTAGVDLSRGQNEKFYPKNALGWYSGQSNTGSILQDRDNIDVYTVDYQGNLHASLRQDVWASDLSFGLQYTDNREDRVGASGLGLVTNAAYSVSAASTISAYQDFRETRQLGYIAQEQIGYKNRAFVQAGFRVDQNSSFGQQVSPFFLPKVGFSYVLSDEPAFHDRLPFFNSLRLRASYGTTGRAPTPGASLQTFSPAPYAITNTSTGAGVVALDPGNNNLKPERGEEYEAGLDAGVLDDRVGLEFSYFHKLSKDLLLQRPLPPSLGFTENPYVNIGSMLNRGIEATFRATPLSLRNFGWDFNVGLSTLHNEITSMGTVAPFGTLNRFQAGAQAGAFYTRKILSVDVAHNRATVTNTPVIVANIWPTMEGNVATDVTFVRNLRLYAQAYWKRGFSIFNDTDDFRERQFATGMRKVLADSVLSPTEKIRRFGPWFDQNGNAVTNVNEVRDAYIQPGDFLRLAEVSLTYTLPRGVAARARATGASVTLGGRNLGLWTKYQGPDPEILQDPNTSFSRTDFLTIPQVRRWVARLNLQF